MSRSSPGPSSFFAVLGLLLGSLLSLAAGAFLAVVLLVDVPVNEFTRPPKAEELKPGQVFLFRGSDIGTTDWRTEQLAWKAGRGGTFTLSESELNRWSGAELKHLATEAAPVPEWVDITIAPPNFRLDGEVIQMAAYVEAPWLNGGRKTILQMQGRLQERLGRQEFVVQQGYLGSFPLHILPDLPQAVLANLKDYFASTPGGKDMAARWGDVSAITVEGGAVALALRDR